MKHSHGQSLCPAGRGRKKDCHLSGLHPKGVVLESFVCQDIPHLTCVNEVWDDKREYRRLAFSATPFPADMTLLLKMSRVGVKSESIEKDELEGVGDDGETREEGLSLSLVHTPRGREGDGFNLSLDLTGSERCVLERTRVEDCGDEVQRNNGLEGFCRSVLDVRLLRGLLLLFMYISISSARLWPVLGVPLLS